MYQDKSSNNKRIAYNTIVLYLRMIITMCVGLFTSRVVLTVLGVEDYGLYNVVGGFVSFFTLFNGAMSNASQRFITFGLAKGDIKRRQDTFSTVVITHLFLALICALLAETVGLWFLYNKMVIPESKFIAALWVYQMSIFSMIVSVASVPYNALIIAYEKMSAFAYISIFDTVMKLVIAYLITVISYDHLIVYAIFLCLVSVFDVIIYRIYCRKNFIETQCKWIFDKDLFKSVNNIAGWSLFGNLAALLYTQGLNLLLNIFFGPVVNAARGVAVTVQGVVTGFVNNFQMALNPQIIKTYAENNLSRMHALIFASSKFSYFMLFIIVLPIMLEAQMVLTLWLKIVPDHTVWFLRIIMCVMLVDTLSNPLSISVQAYGKVKVYQSAVGSMLLTILPIAYVTLRLGGNPESVFIVNLFVAMVAQIMRVYLVSKMVGFSLRDYTKRLILPILMVTVVSGSLSACIYRLFPVSTLSGICVIGCAISISLISIFCVGLNANERDLIKGKLLYYINRIINCNN